MLQKSKSFFSSYIGTKDFYRQTFIIALPIMLQQFISSAVNLVDNIMVSSLGKSAMAAVAVTNKIFFIPQLAIMGALGAAGIFVSQYYGAKDEQKIKETFRFKILVSLSLSLIAVLIVLMFKRPILDVFLDDQVTINHAVSYMNIIIFTQIPLAIIFSIAFTFREIGRPKYALIAGVISILTNTFLNYLLIYGNFGFPELGIVGAAIATGTARIVELSLLVGIMLHKKVIFRTKVSSIFKISSNLIKDITIKGIPLTLNEVLWSSSMTALFYAYSTRGESAIAAFSITDTITGMFYVVFGGMAGATAVMIGNRLGADQLDEARINAKQLLALGLLVTISLSTLLFISSALVPYLFPNFPPETKLMAIKILRIISFFFPFFFLNAGFFFIIRAGGDTKSTLIMDALFMWVVPVPMAIILATFTDLTAPTMYLFIQFADIIKFGIAYNFYKKENWVNNLAIS